MRVDKGEGLWPRDSLRKGKQSVNKMYKTLYEPSDTCSTQRRQPTDQAISVN